MVAKTVVVIPTYNERETVASLVEAVLCCQNELRDFSLNVLVVDSGSPDGTQEAVKKLAQRDSRIQLLQVGERGLGLALMKGYEWAVRSMGAEVIAQMDADFSHDPRDLPKILNSLAESYDLVIGSRYIKGGATRDWPVIRRLLSKGANLAIRLITGVWRVREWTSGYRAFTADLYQRLDLQRVVCPDYTFVPALVYEAISKGARVKEVPILFVNRYFGDSKLPATRYTLNLLRHFLLASLRNRRARLHRTSEGACAAQSNAGGGQPQAGVGGDGS